MTIRKHITVIGKIGNQTNMVHFTNGKTLTRFSISSIKKERNNQGKWVNALQWHNLFAWNSLAEYILENAQKGKSVAVQGKLMDRTYTNRSGVRKKITEIEVKHIIGLN